MSVSNDPCRPSCALRKALARACLTTLLLSPTPGFCYELTLGIDSAYVHDSNFYRSQIDEVTADSIEVGGNISLEQQQGRLRYLASYAGSYQWFREQDEANAPEHRLRLHGSYDIDPLTTLQLKDNFRDVRNLRFSREDILDGDSGLESNNDRYQRNDLELILHRDITRSWELEINATHQFIEFDNNVNRSDSQSIGVGGRVLHRFTPRHRFGGGLSWVGQDFDGADTRLDAEADYLIMDLAWVFDIGEQVQLVVNGGPAWIKTDQDAPDFVQQTQFVGGNQGGDVFRANVRSCAFNSVTATGIASRCDFITPGAQPIPADDLGERQGFSLSVVPQVGEDEDTTFFGGVSLEARFSDWTVDVELRRQQSATTGDAIAASLTMLRWDFGYAPAGATWDAYVAGAWERRESLSDSTTIDYTVIPGPEEAAQRTQAFTRPRDPDDRRDAFTALLGVRKKFSPSLAGSVGVRFRRTERRVSGRESETDTYFFVVKMSYVFDTIRF